MDCGERRSDNSADGLPATHSPVPDSAAAVFWRNRATGLFDRIPLPAAFCKADGTILRANPALAAEWGRLAGSLRGCSALELFHPEARDQLRSIAEAIRLHRRSRYPMAVRWTTAGGVERRGEVSVDLVDDTSIDEPNLLVIVHVVEEEPIGPSATVDDTEARILALTAGGATAAQIASAVGLTADGVNYHLKQLSRRWGVSGKAALVARAYVEGILAPDVWPPVPVHNPYRTVR
ncbi:PAS domain-containing protein [Streptomyces sp. NPDC001833]|uniref:PAS domain-containing protein n=1 Tax=Streptomyces sp. NPDC001833 TaxID=3154658 RepID=UPI00332FF657